ncbi:hypothetical protein B0H13DRAFT_2312562 [Mycena leptocephala]|nr:hypothetical protein B0H13DRAFT_2312562 [Mycena leptocephala]
MPTEPKASTGPPQALIYCIEHLQQLLKHLLSSLLLDPAESLYQFYIDEDRVADAGTVFSACKFTDDSDVPLAAIMKDSLDININPASYTEEFIVPRTACTQKNDGLTTNDSAEDVWAYMENGLRWYEVSEVQVVDTD